MSGASLSSGDITVRGKKTILMYLKFQWRVNKSIYHMLATINCQAEQLGKAFLKVTFKQS